MAVAVEVTDHDAGREDIVARVRVGIVHHRRRSKRRVARRAGVQVHRHAGIQIEGHGDVRD